MLIRISDLRNTYPTEGIAARKTRHVLRYLMQIALHSLKDLTMIILIATWILDVGHSRR